jgi:hypothetical protein
MPSPDGLARTTLATIFKRLGTKEEPEKVRDLR